MPKKRTWDAKRATALLRAGRTDKEVASLVGASFFAIRTYRYATLGIRRRERHIVSMAPRVNYKALLNAWLEKKAKEYDIPVEKLKYHLFQTPEGIAYCEYMNRELAK